MPGREFLEVARELLTSGSLPRHWRAAITHAYYSLLLECRDAMTRWGLPLLTRQQVHAQVRLRLVYANDPDLRKVGFALEKLGERRNAANYDLRPLPLFATAREAKRHVQMAADALALLDAIEVDAVRRAAAVSSIRP